MALETYPYAPVLVDLPDHATGIKLRARRVAVHISDNAEQPLRMDVELIPYAPLADGGYGEELTSSVFTRHLCPPLTVSRHRLVEKATGRIRASRFAADGSWRSDADWQADVDRLRDDESVVVMAQNDWFTMLLAQGLPAPIDAFSVQYILLAHASGDLK